MNKALFAVLLAGALWAQTPQPPEPPQAPRARASSARAYVMAMQGGSGSFLGIGVAEIDEARAKALNLKETRGVEVTQVEQDGPAAKAGLQKGDVVLEYNNSNVEGTEQFVRLVRETPVGRAVKLTISRNGNQQTVTTTTAARKGARLRTGEQFHFEMPPMPNIHIPDVPRPYMGWRSSMVGIEAESIDSQLAEYFGVKEGVLVRSVVKGSAAEKAGLKAGDVIVKVDGEKVANPRDISTVVRSKSGPRTLSMTVVRERRETTVSVSVEDDAGPRQPAVRRSRTIKN